MFLLTELDTGLTFARIASRSRDKAKIARCTANARLAYDTAMSWKIRVLMPEADAARIEKKFAHLKTKLIELGEDL